MDTFFIRHENFFGQFFAVVENCSHWTKPEGGDRFMAPSPPTQLKNGHL